MIPQQSQSRRLPASFGWLNTTQFLGALNDNLFKFFIVFHLIRLQGEGSESSVNAMAGAIFVIPFLVFAATAGVLADRLSKRRVIVTVKACEVAVMSIGAVAFLSGQAWTLYGVLFLMALQSTFFGPSKYGIVPELVGRERLSRANGYLQAFTYLAIIFGTVLAPAMGKALDGNYAVAALLCIGVAVTGCAASTRIEPTPVAGPDARFSWLFLRDIARTLHGIRHDRFLVLAVLASAYFLMIAAFMQFNIIPYGRQVLGLTPEDSTLVFLFAALGIGVGSMAAGRLSGRNVEFGLVPVGALLLTISTIGLYLTPPHVHAVQALMTLCGIGAGIFIVPLQAFIQFRSPRERLGEILAASSFLSWGGVLLASGMLAAFSGGLGLSAAQGYLIIGLMTLILTILSFVVLPDFFLRFVVLLLTRLVYRLRTVGLDHVPVEGPALLVANHASWSDAALLMATQQRRLKFLMAREMYDGMRWARPFLNLIGVIPVSGRDARGRIEASMQMARQALDEGYMVCIFAEGALTRSGMMRPFKRGFARILKGTSHPIIPVYIGGAWGSFFSYYHGKLFARLPRRVPYPVTIHFGEPMPTDSTAAQVRLRVQELSGDYFRYRTDLPRSLADGFVCTARSRRRAPAIADTTGRALTFGETLTAALALRRVLRRIAPDQQRIGIMLPASVPAALANLAVTLAGKVAVNLNFTAPRDALHAAAQYAGLQTILTADAFLKRLPEGLAPPGTVAMEALRDAVTPRDKTVAWCAARWAPRRWLLPALGAEGRNTPAAILFSSGSTGRPKGIVLSHLNILADVESACRLIRVDHNDAFAGVLPFFHAFGFTATFWLPMVSGCRADYHPNPLEASKVATMVRDRQCTILGATPAMLDLYLRKAEPTDFQSLRLCVVGADRLRQQTADAFANRFGIRPLEGYGTTELSPMASFNVPDVVIDGIRQTGDKPGTIGHPLPGVAMMVVDPETHTPLPTGREGLLWVKGPIVMLGYLDDDAATNKVLHDGWYNTGDVARIDSDGFVTLVGRLSRFSKIGGEMIPHQAVEEVLLASLDTDARAVAVTAVSDPRKGERLVILYTHDAGNPDSLHQTLAKSSLPNLWKPRRNEFFLVDQIPTLPTGKLDLHSIQSLANSLSQHNPDPNP